MFAFIFLAAEILESALNGSAAEDAELARKASAGDGEAFEKLMKKYEKMVFNTACAILGKEDDAPDVVQETFLRVFRSLPSFRGDSLFSTWVYRICVNCAKDQKRKNSHRSLHQVSLFVPDDEGEEKMMEIADGEADPEELVGKREEKKAVWDAIGKLSEEHRTVIVMRDMEGRSYEEIGKILGIGQGTVKSRISRARNAVKNILLEGNFI